MAAPRRDRSLIEPPTSPPIQAGGGQLGTQPQGHHRHTRSSLDPRVSSFIPHSISSPPAALHSPALIHRRLRLSIPLQYSPWDRPASPTCWIRLTSLRIPTPSSSSTSTTTTLAPDPHLRCGFGFGLYLLRHSSTPSCIDIMAATVASSQAPPNLNSTPSAPFQQQQQQQQRVNDAAMSPAAQSHATPEPLPATKTFTPDDFKLVRTLGTGTCFLLWSPIRQYRLTPCLSRHVCSRLSRPPRISRQTRR